MRRNLLFTPYKIIILIIFLIISCFIIYNILPIEIKYYYEIKIGNKIVNELNNYYSINNTYPIGFDLTKENSNEHDWKTNEEIYRKAFLGYDKIFDGMTQRPFYERLGDEYLLVYIYSFDPPYLFFYSKTNKWEYSVPP